MPRPQGARDTEALQRRGEFGVEDFLTKIATDAGTQPTVHKINRLGYGCPKIVFCGLYIQGLRGR